MDQANSNQVSATQRFWNAFQACVEENRVGSDRSVFYVRWAQGFVRFMPEKRLRDRSRQDIEAFLIDLRQRPGITDWQVKQAEQALKMLYEVFLPGYAPERTPKPIQETEEERPAKGLDPGTGSFRDRVVPGEVERLFSPLLDAIKTEIRSRHYSIRTETAYVD